MKFAALFKMSILFFVSTAFAVEEVKTNEPIDGIIDDSSRTLYDSADDVDAVLKGEHNIGRWLVNSDPYGRSGSQIPGNIFIKSIRFSRSQYDTSTQELWATLWIALCQGGPGEACRKQFSIGMHCRDAYNQTFTIWSPYYRNLSTDGTYTTRYYSFSSENLRYCDNIDSFEFSTRDNW